jgi:hypothetical protein
MVFQQRFALRTLAAALLALAAVLCLQVTRTSAAMHLARRTPAGTSASARLAPFKMYFSVRTIVGVPDEVHLTRIVILRTKPGERVVMECIRCRGGGQRSAQARGGKTIFSLSHVIVTDRSRLVVDVTKAGSIGRFKEYTLRPRLRSHRLLHQGCLAIDVYERIDCSASGRVDIPVGAGAVAPGLRPSCPGDPCLALARTTGFQVSLAEQTPVSTVSLSGHVVAWQIALSTPAPNQISYFDTTEAGPAQAAIAILRPQSQTSHTYELIAQSPLVMLQPYFGTTARFPLESALPVKRGDVIALTTPTWAPALATGEASDALWRSSRQSSQCSTASEQAADTQVGALVEYACLYRTAVLTYSATLRPEV